MFRKKLVDLYLKEGFSILEASSEVDFILEVEAGLSAKDVLMGKEVAQDIQPRLVDIVKNRVSSKRPIAQILGKSYFMGELFKVNEFTLIPRPETEILVRETLNIAEDISGFEILDIGTGSGCIPIMIAKNTSKIKIQSVDISEEAINIAQKNANFHIVDEKINFYKSNVFESIEDKFDIIVSNPPYIPLEEKKNLQLEVREFEPERALFAEDEQGISFYKKIIEESSAYLKKTGFIAFELGIGQVEIVEKIFLENGFSNIKIFKDLDGIARVITAQFMH